MVSTKPAAAQLAVIEVKDRLRCFQEAFYGWSDSQEVHGNINLEARVDCG